MGKTSEFFVLREIASYVSTKSALVPEQQLNVAVAVETSLSWSGHLTSREAAVYPNSSYKDFGAKAQIFAIQSFGGVAH